MSESTPAIDEHSLKAQKMVYDKKKEIMGENFDTTGKIGQKLDSAIAQSSASGQKTESQQQPVTPTTTPEPTPVQQPKGVMGKLKSVFGF